MIGILRRYIRQRVQHLPFRCEVLHDSGSSMWSHSSGGFGGIDNVPSSSEGSLLVDNLVIMLRLDAIMHRVS